MIEVRDIPAKQKHFNVFSIEIYAWIKGNHWVGCVAIDGSGNNWSSTCIPASPCRGNWEHWDSSPWPATSGYASSVFGPGTDAWNWNLLIYFIFFWQLFSHIRKGLQDPCCLSFKRWQNYVKVLIPA
jgi:hypothetical protein